MAFKYPPEWTDEERMYFLIAPFPPNYQISLSNDKIIFWKSLIHSSCRELCQWVFTERELLERFTWRGLLPKCLSVVISSLEKSGELRRISEYQVEEMGWTEWGMKLLYRPISWAWQKYISTSGTSDEAYTLVELLKELNDQVLSEHFKNVVHVTTDCVMSYTQFEQLCRRVTRVVDKKSLQVLQLQLLEDKAICKGVSKESNEVIVKFASSRHEHALPITEIDIGILSIKTTITKLKEKLEYQEHQHKRLKMKCMECYKRKHKKEAISYLREFKKVDKMTSSLQQQLTNLETIFNQIQMSETDAKVLKAYESGLAALRNIRDKHDLSLERIQDVVDDMQELIEEEDQIMDVLAGDLVLQPFDEDELLEELNALELEDENVIVPEEPIAKVPETLQVKTKRKTDLQTQEEEPEQNMKKSIKIKSKPMLIS